MEKKRGAGGARVNNGSGDARERNIAAPRARGELFIGRYISVDQSDKCAPPRARRGPLSLSLSHSLARSLAGY